MHTCGHVHSCTHAHKFCVRVCVCVQVEARGHPRASFLTSILTHLLRQSLFFSEGSLQLKAFSGFSCPFRIKSGTPAGLNPSADWPLPPAFSCGSLFLTEASWPRRLTASPLSTLPPLRLQHTLPMSSLLRACWGLDLHLPVCKVSALLSQLSPPPHPGPAFEQCT